MTKIAIASGKGGTGKTTLAVNLAALFREQGRRVVFADCDVEEPNAHLFLDVTWSQEQPATLFTPHIDENTCLGEECGECVRLCAFKALILMAGEVMVFPELCHGCTLCVKACPHDAVSEAGRELGIVRRGAASNMDMLGGLMRVGEAMATPLIRAVKDAAEATAAGGSTDPITIWDCPPGTACPVIEALSDADYVLLACEPTPFGLHDLKLAVGLVRELGLPHGAVINRDGMGDDRVKQYLTEENIPLLAAIPHSLEAARACSEGKLLMEVSDELRGVFSELAHALIGEAGKEASS
ncbi:MAG: (4Fe-4S)-binding protein [Desulfovibrio sp.]|nr:MAG: (4Fe-4S)-binding protein [Desulfovibrio sp.]